MSINGYLLAKKLIRGINHTTDYKLTLNSTEFIGRDGQPHKLYVLKNATMESGGWQYSEMYKTASPIRLALYLRDLLCIERGEELPTGDEFWDPIRLQLIEKGNVLYGQYRN